MSGDVVQAGARLEAISFDDPVVFERFVSKYHAVIFAVCLSFLRHRQDAEDATQETFSRFYRHRRRFDFTRPVEPYLKRIAGNRCRTLLSKRRYDRSLVSVEEPQTNSPRLEQEASQWGEELQLAMHVLPRQHRKAFEMFHVEHLSYVEIAEAIGRPVGTVKTWVHRARGRLISELSRRDQMVGPAK